MNNTATSTTPAPERWALSAVTPAIGPDELARWTKARVGLKFEAELRGYSKTLMAKRIGMANSTFSQWFDGNYQGDFEAKTALALAYLDKASAMAAEAIKAPLDPGFVDIPTARDVLSVFTAAMSLGAMALVTLAAGMGKTSAARHFQERFPRVAIATMRPTITSPERAIREVAKAFGVEESGYQPMIKALTARFGKDSDHALLIVDEAQFLSDASVNEIRMLRDQYKVGVVLLGNEEIYGRYSSGDGVTMQAQIRRRISWRLKRMENTPADIAGILDAWGVADAQSRDMCARIARKPGRIGTMVETLRLAHIIAAGHERAVAAEDIRAAWSNRTDGGERL